MVVRFMKDALKRSLKKYPILTNSSVYASFFVAADLSQQTIIRMSAPKNEVPAYNYGNTARIAFVGSAIYSPTLYYWYAFLDKTFAGTAPKTVLTKVLADQFIITPILLATFYTTMGVLEQREDIFEELREKYWRTFLANQSFWIPMQSVNFYFIPPNLRVVFVAAASFIWINVVCYIKRN